MNREEHLQKIFPTEDGKTYIQSLDEFNSKSKKNKSISLRFQNWHKMMPLETETIIHLAAINLNPQDSAFDEEYFRVNTELTSKLFRYFLNSNAKTFIFLSTTELIDKQISEATEDAKVNPTNPFLQSKFDAEQFILKQDLPEGKRAIILRAAPVYGREIKSPLHDTFIFCKKFRKTSRLLVTVGINHMGRHYTCNIFFNHFY